MKSLSTNNHEFLIDDSDYERVSNLNWVYCYNPKINYGSLMSGRVHLARFITNCPKEMIVDHINGDTLDNRSSNLRICTRAENQANRKLNKNNKTGYKGVISRKRKNGSDYFCAELICNRKSYKVCGFHNAKEAAMEYDKLSEKHHGIFGRKNFACAKNS